MLLCFQKSLTSLENVALEAVIHTGEGNNHVFNTKDFFSGYPKCACDSCRVVGLGESYGDSAAKGEPAETMGISEMCWACHCQRGARGWWGCQAPSMQFLQAQSY